MQFIDEGALWARRFTISASTVAYGLSATATVEVLEREYSEGAASRTGWSGLIYFSGVNLATLGYRQMETCGPIRMIVMMQSLGGFMVLTWSATFLYSVSEPAWSD